MDLASPDRLQTTRDAFAERGIECLPMSAVTGEGLDPVVHAAVAGIDSAKADA